MNRFEHARDLRQLRFMLSTLRSYEMGHSGLPRLIEDLEELLLSLSDESPAWREQLRTALSVLKGRGGDDIDVDAASTTTTNQAVQRLTGLVQNEIERRGREQPGA